MPFMHLLAPRRFSMLLLMLGLFAAGCAPGLYDTRPTRRAPAQHRTVIVDTPPPAVSRRVRSDVRTYVDRMDRVLRLNRQQERTIEQLLTNRAYELLAGTSPRAHAQRYPFPRPTARHERTREVRRWWSRTDAAIERVLDRRQQRIYRDFARDGVARPHRGRPAHPHGGPPGRGR